MWFDWILAQQQRLDAADVDLLAMLANASPAVMLAMFIVALLRRWLILPRELDDRDQHIKELERERDEYKAMLFKALAIGERVTHTVERREV